MCLKGLNCLFSNSTRILGIKETRSRQLGLDWEQCIEGRTNQGMVSPVFFERLFDLLFEIRICFRQGFVHVQWAANSDSNRARSLILSTAPTVG